MEEWLKISGFLCVFGLLREIRPSEPYFTEFIVGEWRNITLEELYRDGFPIGTYSNLAHLILIFLITDYFRYKPLIIVSEIAAIIAWCLLIWTKSLQELQIVFLFFGTYNATEVAYFTYIYAKVDKKYYPKVTSHTRAALFTGKLIASILSQILVYFKWMNYLELNYITLAAQIASLFCAIFLPNVKSSIYFHRGESSNKKDEELNTEDGDAFNKSTLEIIAKNPINPFKLIYLHFKRAYTNRNVLQWSIWYATILCGYLQTYNYIQTLWKGIEPDQTIVWNGAVEAVLTLLGAIGALSVGYIHISRLSHRSNILIVSGLSILEGSALLLVILSRNLYIGYVGYIVFGTLYALSITISGAEVAKYLEEESFGLVFGVNTFVALFFQTILTLLVVDGHVIVLDIFEQYLIYAGFFIIVGVLFCIFVLVESLVEYLRRNN